MNTTKSSDFADFDISEDDDQWHAVGHGLVISVDKDGPKPMCHRRALKKNLMTDQTIHDSALRCELDDVKVYIKPGHIIITKKVLHL